MTSSIGNKTLEDIARISGVSLSTVSRVLNRTTPVSPTLMARVERAMEEIGFVPKRLNSSGKGSIIAFVIPNILDPYYSEMVSGAQLEAAAHGFSLIILNTTEDSDQQRQTLMILRKWPIDGVVVVDTVLPREDIIELHERHKLPVVLIGRDIGCPNIQSIRTDAEDGAYRAARHLLDYGHCRLATIAGPSSWRSTQSRLKGVERAAEERGLELNREDTVFCIPDSEGGFHAATALLARDETQRPTAIVAFNDLVAIGALHAADSLGIPVPQKLSVVGFDDILFARHCRPPLTTISQPKERMGALALRVLAQRLGGDESGSAGFILMETPLILRESTAMLF